MARKYQDRINEYDGTPNETLQFASNAVRALDRECGHMNTDMVVTGQVLFHKYPLRYLDPSQRLANPEQLQEDLRYVENLAVRSLGYIVRKKTSDPDEKPTIEHAIIRPAQEICSIPAVGIYQLAERGVIDIHDTAVAVCAADLTEPHMPALQYYVGELLGDIETAVHHSDDPSASLRNLSKVDFAKWQQPLADDQISADLENYLNKVIPFKKNIPHRVAGMRDICVVTDQDYKTYQLPAGKRPFGSVDGIRLLYNGEGNKSPFLSMQSVFSDSQTRQILIPLSNRLYVTELDSFSIE